ncbi:hypothetical protein GCM10025879_18400 [Leuconostoc litchii]|uniref:DUF7671 domain-containing protein n=1 Tax=Leuconostoc litchii TaxID=1981069 RepID=A0A6P2CLF8_9LACO|nr:hypothetical protein [Leuconostoc litchii]TYC46716.1 hypothetical protein ESZ47_00835 [Leuconostoc litchii]GMA70594.1 hypothetical protein GCM10025879_18400 [Leuconostoc litchii]
MTKNKYETNLFNGVVVEQNASGEYVPKKGSTVHSWRTGKHTKGHYKHFGQVFLTENNQSVAVISKENLAFNERHNYAPLQRWTDAVAAIKELNVYKKDEL